MADEKPGAFGIDSAISRLERHLDEKFTLVRDQLLAVQTCLERKLNTMPTQADFDQFKQQMKQAIADATARVTTDIQALRDQLANGVQVTDADLAEFQEDLGNVANIDPANPQPPTSRRR